MQLIPTDSGTPGCWQKISLHIDISLHCQTHMTTRCFNCELKCVLVPTGYFRYYPSPLSISFKLGVQCFPFLLFVTMIIDNEIKVLKYKTVTACAMHCGQKYSVYNNPTKMPSFDLLWKQNESAFAMTISRQKLNSHKKIIHSSSFF